MALIGSTVAVIKVGARLDGEADGIEQAKRAILRFLDGAGRPHPGSLSPICATSWSAW